MLLLRDFLRLSASVLPTSMVAFSLSVDLRVPLCRPSDLRGRRFVESADSPLGAIVRAVNGE